MCVCVCACVWDHSKYDDCRNGLMWWRDPIALQGISKPQRPRHRTYCKTWRNSDITDDWTTEELSKGDWTTMWLKMTGEWYHLHKSCHFYATVQCTVYCSARAHPSGAAHSWNFEFKFKVETEGPWSKTRFKFERSVQTVVDATSRLRLKEIAILILPPLPEENWIIWMGLRLHGKPLEAAIKAHLGLNRHFCLDNITILIVRCPLDKVGTSNSSVSLDKAHGVAVTLHFQFWHTHTKHTFSSERFISRFRYTGEG